MEQNFAKIQFWSQIAYNRYISIFILYVLNGFVYSSFVMPLLCKTRICKWGDAIRCKYLPGRYCFGCWKSEPIVMYSTIKRIYVDYYRSLMAWKRSILMVIFINASCNPSWGSELLFGYDLSLQPNLWPFTNMLNWL